MFSEAEINNRREVKRRVVNQLIDLAVQFPACADGNGVCWEPGVPAVAINQLWAGISGRPADRLAIRTGKGCGRVPKDVPIESGFHGTTMADFLEWGASDGGKAVDCWGSYITIGYRWAVQIIDSNPHSFPAGSALKKRVTDAIAAADAAKRAEWAAAGII